MNTPTHAVFDMDCVKYTVASGGEKRPVTATNIHTKECYTVDNITKWWGHYSKKNGGLLEELNKGRVDKLLPTDFTYETHQIPIPLDHCLNNVKKTVQKHLAMSGGKSYHGYIGRGDSWRINASTILKYKGNREGLIKPIHLNAVEDYLLEYCNTTVASYWEADEVVVWDVIKDKNAYAIFEDKDFFGCPIKGFNIRTPDLGINNYNNFGSLAKVKVKDGHDIIGKGRLWFYFQVASGDTSDNYKANSASSIKWGPASAYNKLHTCKSDKEALAALVDIYKYLYPTKAVVKGWRGNDIEIDWLYMLNENFTMARMYRHKEDHVNVENVLAKFNLL